MDIDWDDIPILERRKIINAAFRSEGDTKIPLVEFWREGNRFYARSDVGKQYEFRVRGFGKTTTRNIIPNKDGSITIPADSIEFTLTASWEPVE